jgi:hypothetical protein
MRTTLDIDDHLYRAAKQRAADEARTLTSVVEEALRGLLARRRQPARPYSFDWVTVAGRRDAGVIVEDRDALYGRMEEGD